MTGKDQKTKNRRKDVIPFLIQICEKQKMQQSWWFRFLTSNHVNSTKKCIEFVALDQAPLLCVCAWATTERFVFWLLLRWTSIYSYAGPGSGRSWLFRCFMHYIGLRPDWLALVVSGVFYVYWKLVGWCLYFVFMFQSCIAGPRYSWFVGVFICVCVPKLPWIRV